MSGSLTAQFEKRFARGPTIAGELRTPADAFHVTVLFGPSGCGKTTVLRCLAGLERPEAGRIEFCGEPWFDGQQRVFRSPQQRDVGFLFQDYALFPHLTVGENIGYGLRRQSAAERQQRITAMLEKFELRGLAARFPQQLSGGQQQRVALARVLVRRPRMLLLDEPLSALDSGLRETLRGELRRLLTEFAIPCVLVTHDRTEAMALADQVVVMHEGRVLQHGSMQEVFGHPVSSEVARIVGIETILSGEVISVKDGLAQIEVAGVRLTAKAPADGVRHVHVCLKAEDLMLMRGPHPDLSLRNQFPAVVEWLTTEGPLVRVGLRGGFAVSALVTRPACEELRLAAGEQVTVGVKAPSIHLIPRAGE